MIRGEDLPGTLPAFLTILIPVVLIAGSSFINMCVAEDAAIRNWTAIFGDKIVALGLGVIYTMLLGCFHQKAVRKSDRDSTHKEQEKFHDILLNSWIARGCEVALPALLITSMGGAFSAVIKSAPAIDGLASMIVESGIPGLLVPFLISAIMMAAVGSATTAGITAAGVVLPMMGTLGITPVATTLAIGAGSILFNYMNNSGFWVISRFFNLNLKQGIKYITVPCGVSSLMCFILIAIFTSIGIM